MVTKKKLFQSLLAMKNSLFGTRERNFRWFKGVFSVSILTVALGSECGAQQEAVPTRENDPTPTLSAKLRSAMPQMPCEKPEWPHAALWKRLTGTVTMKFLIDSDGRVLEKEIVKSSGHTILDVAALEATARCKLIVAPLNDPLQTEWVVNQYVWTFPTLNP